ncbi:MAG: hypothetical protein AAGI11_15025 [Pseudomonadota bacterium]
MKLVTHSVFAKRYFEQGSRPTKEQCIQHILDGTWEGRIAGSDVWIDENHFLSSVNHQPTATVRKASGMTLLT